MESIVGTAGHIDHGKTALVKALTGVDADRLPEEKRRGITIDIGFAEMTIGEAHFGFVDVPGHERFVKNMLAGASGIDLVLLVVAADEGVMPQTREHFEICRLLGVERGIVALTKSDLVDADTLDLARLDVAELVAGSFLENAPVVAVSSKTGDDIDKLREVLLAETLRASPRSEGSAFSEGSESYVRASAAELVTRLPIDRSFSMKGFGAVVTGTLASGEISEGDELELLPTGTKVRVRGIQSHGKKVQKVTSGRRVAVNLGGIDHADVARGMTLVEPNTLDATQAFDAEVEVLAAAPRSLRSRQRVRVHIGTAEALARVQVLNETAEIGQGETDLVQLRFETPIVAVPGERFILRSYSPQMTIAGGVVIDNSPQRHRRRDLAVIRTALSTSRGELGGPQAMVEHLVAAADASGTTFTELQAGTALKKAVLDVAIAHAKEKGSVVELDRRYLAGLNFQQLAAAMDDAVAVFHKKEPLAKGIPREILRERVFAFLPDEVFEGVLAASAAKGTITLDKETIRLTMHSAELSPEESAVSDKISSTYANARLEVPKVEDVLAVAVAGTTLSNGNAKKLLQKAIDAGKIVRVSDEFCFSKQAIEHLREKLKAFADTTPDRLIDVPKFKEIAGVSRKYAIPLLEYFDRVHMTARAGDKRVIL